MITMTAITYISNYIREGLKTKTALSILPGWDEFPRDVNECKTNIFTNFTSNFMSLI
jgi:hypothetical protein